MHRCLGCMEEYKEAYQVCPYCGYEVGTPPKEAYHMVPGTMLHKRYTVGQVIGFGGFGVTYIGFDNTLQRKVAIKEYLPSEFSTRIPGQTEVTTYAGERTEQFNGGLTKFVEEAKTLAKFQSANGIVQIYNSFQENNTAYIVMEYLEGKTLKTYLEEKGRLPVEEAMKILEPVIQSLMKVHGIGIIHRDIAPDNIFLTKDGKVKLLDFGAARFATTTHSKSLSVIIKQGYAPVEQYRSRGDQGSWTDVYSLAATFYKMVTGVTPEDAMERLEKNELKKPSALGVSISKNTETAIMNALNIKVEDRTPNIETFEQELYHDENVKSRKQHLGKGDVGKWPLWAKISVSGASVAVATFAVLLLTGIISFSRIEIPDFMIPEGQTRVPNVVNGEVDVAEATLSEAELYFQIVDKQNSEYIPEGLVLSQSIDKGKIVEINNVVEVVVSGGQERIIMPDVYAYTRDDAVSLLSAQGLVVETTEEYGDLAVGAVLAQSVAAGEETYRGTTIVLTISKGYDSYLDEEGVVDVPDFTGLTLQKAQALAKQYGLYIVKTGTKKASGKAGSILEQTPVAGSEAHQGDTISVITVEEESQIYMPDVQYKSESDAIAALEALGLTVTTSYEKSSQVAQGKVISQSVASGTVMKSGQSVSLVVSLGEETVNKVMAQWSDWVAELPDGVNKSSYDIEDKTQYSYRDKSTTTSTSSSLDGWTQYDKVTTKGEYGEWSAWSTQKPEAKSNRQIEEKKQYASSDYQTTSTEEANLAGWTLINTETKYRDHYGDWSAWSETEYTASDTRKVEDKDQYQYRTRSWTSQNNNSSMSGWTCDDSRTSVSYGEWSEWTETPITGSSTLEVATEDRTRQVQTGTRYHYYRYKYWNTSANGWYLTYSSSMGGNRETTYKDNSPLGTWKNYDGHQSYGSNGDFWFYDYEEALYTNETYTVYRSRSVTTTYQFYQWSDWSDWIDGTMNGDSNTEVNTRKLHRYADKPTYNYYTYERWTDYSGWSDTPITETPTKRVKDQTMYKYRDQTDVVTYYFYQWGGWSDWTDEKIDKSDTRDVQTRELHRYKQKA